MPLVTKDFWKIHRSTQPVKTQNLLRRNINYKVDEDHYQRLNEMIYTKMTATKESENDKIRQELTFKRIWRLVRDFYNAEISSQI